MPDLEQMGTMVTPTAVPEEEQVELLRVEEEMEETAEILDKVQATGRGQGEQVAVDTMTQQAATEQKAVALSLRCDQFVDSVAAVITAQANCVRFVRYAVIPGFFNLQPMTALRAFLPCVLGGTDYRVGQEAQHAH